jgi:hypothetical protein
MTGEGLGQLPLPVAQSGDQLSIAGAMVHFNQPCWGLGILVNLIEHCYQAGDHGLTGHGRGVVVIWFSVAWMGAWCGPLVGSIPVGYVPGAPAACHAGVTGGDGLLPLGLSVAVPGISPGFNVPGFGPVAGLPNLVGFGDGHRSGGCELVKL